MVLIDLLSSYNFLFIFSNFERSDPKTLLNHDLAAIADVDAFARGHLVELHAIEGVYTPLSLWRGAGGEAFYPFSIFVGQGDEGAGV